MHPDDAASSVPAAMHGAWRRAWIRHADGSVDDTSTVVWIQLESTMADIRLPLEHRELAGRGSLAECSLDDLRRLAVGESSTGRTECSPIDVTDSGVLRATAEWVHGHRDVAFQPVTAYPEPGFLEWSNDRSVMTERAPSGAYVEEWTRVPDTDKPLSHEWRSGAQIFRAGSTAMLVRDRPKPVTRSERLDVLVAEASDDRGAIEALVDCEFSLATVVDGVATITASTLPWRVGDEFDVAG